MRIILAVDPFEESLRLSPPDFSCLKSWVQNPQAEILPVYVLPNSETSRDLDNIWLPDEFKDFAPLKILPTKALGRKREAEALLNYTDEVQADVVVLVSHGTLTAKKLYGGFVESILLKSEKPIVVLAENSKSNTTHGKLIFISDFSKESYEAFSIFISNFKDIKPSVLLFNAIPLPAFTRSGPIYQQALDILPVSYWHQQETWAAQLAEPFLKIASEKQIICQLEIRSQVISVEDAIKDLLEKEDASLFAMVTVSGTLQRLLVGSISRFVLKHRKQPLWLCGPQGFKS
jgi:nucleotide-binding universal stress UspA family protein